jgi:hypothetical protein
MLSGRDVKKKEFLFHFSGHTKDDQIASRAYLRKMQTIRSTRFPRVPVPFQ